MTEEIQYKPLVLNPPPNITRVNSVEQLELLEKFFENNKEHGFDVETDPKKDYFWRRCRTIQFGTAKEQYVIDVLAFCENDPEMLFMSQGHYGVHVKICGNLEKLINFLEKYLCSNEYLKVGVNLGFEYMTMYWNFGLRIFGLYDCALVEKCIYAGLHTLKDYHFYSMEEMMKRNFQVQIDKELQTSFTLDEPLTDAQYEYAALDTRTPLSLKFLQGLIISGKTPKYLKGVGKPIQAKYLENLNKVILGDNLEEIVQIENDAIGAFEDMHIHGERIDTEKWLERIKGKKFQYFENIATMDKLFLPVVGSKHEVVTDEMIEEATAKWKNYNEISEQEITMKLGIRKLKKQGEVELAEALQQEVDKLELQRKIDKEPLKKAASELKKKRTKINKLAAQCEGQALINYSSNAQLLKTLREMYPSKLKDIKKLNDKILEKYSRIPAMAAIKIHHVLGKEIGTYGDQWATQWKTKPCKEEGWLHPGDGRLHSKFNQYEAETGRSSSEQPNGQNIPQDTEIRSCFIADEPNEEIRISSCCDSETIEKLHCYVCKECGKVCDTHAEEYVIITADMAGAELRIIADDADDEVWITAFKRGEDVHSVGTELLYEDEWPKMRIDGCAYFKTHTEETVAKNPNCILGDAMRQKCKCPDHASLRNENKSTNFLLAYGGGSGKLAGEIGKSVAEAAALMARHEKKNPKIWAYLKKSGQMAQMLKKAFDLWGRRRIFPEPTQEMALENCKEWNEEKLRLDDEKIEENYEIFEQIKGRKPTESEQWDLEHRQPTPGEISKSFFQLSMSIDRQGKNMRIQGSNATIIKIAMGCGFAPDGSPFLWHVFPKFRAKLIKMVHDELVVQSPKQHAEKVAAEIGEAFKKAAATKMKKVEMLFDYHIAKFWKK